MTNRFRIVALEERIAPSIAGFLHDLLDNGNGEDKCKDSATTSVRTRTRISATRTRTTRISATTRTRISATTRTRIRISANADSDDLSALAFPVSGPGGPPWATVGSAVGPDWHGLCR